jgi:lysozyme family protein
MSDIVIAAQLTRQYENDFDKLNNLDGYWNDLYNQIYDQNIANKLFDMGVLLGVKTAVKVLQEIFERHNVTVDGVFGLRTLDVLNTAEPVGFLAAYKTALVSHVLGVMATNPDARLFFAEWARRINS